MIRIVATYVMLSVLVIGASAQSNVDPVHKSAWAENVGWMNWRDAGAPPAAQGVTVHASFLSGYIWSENAGWITVGDGTPGNGVSYANATAADFGVNRAPAGTLTGYAWAENAGWINFSGGALAAPPNAARIDASANPPRLRGYAWGENIGWINLDDAVAYVAVILCNPCDVTCDGTVNLFDIQPFVDVLAGSVAPCSPCAADANGDGSLNLFDIQSFVDCLGT